MADQSSTTDAPGVPPPPRRRRSSFAEMFNPRPSSNAPTSSSVPPTGSTGTSNPPSHHRALSQALGISGGSPTQSSPFTAFAKQRRASVSTSSASGSPEFRNSFGDEPAVIEEDGDDVVREPVRTPTSPMFARRLSFGAQALRDVKTGGNGGGPAGGRRPSSTLYSLSKSQENKASRTATTGGEGFNWAEAIRERNKRSPSFSASNNSFALRPRAPSATAVKPPKEIPKPAAAPPRMKKPDHLGERMLRGDFMMD